MSSPASAQARKSSSVSKVVAAAATIAGLVLITGCTANPTPTDSNGNPNVSPSAAATVTAPLTGIQYTDGSNTFLAGPVVMGKIDNSPEARPQLGLSQADVVIDEMVEGGLTRFLAIWQSNQPAEFGPIRSVRPMDPDLATAFGGVIAYSGGQRPFIAAMQATGIYNATETSEQALGTMERVKDRYAPHNLFVKAQVLQSQHMALGAPRIPFTFSSDLAGASAVIDGSTSVQSVSAQFPAATALWTWNGKSFVRTQDGKPLTDALDGKQLKAVNVVVLRVAVDRSFRDPRYGFVPKTLLEGTGTGTVFTGGKALEVTWTKNNAGDYVALTEANGSIVKLAPGNTWFELVPTDVGKVTVTPVASASPKPAGK